MQFTVPEYPLRLLLALQEGYCNLKCPMCYVHSPSSQQKVTRGTMSLGDMVRILDEFPDPKPTISPITWAEPLMLKDFEKYIIAIKERGFPISLNTNGLLLTKELAQLMVDIEVDSVFISVDAHSAETLEKVRGISDLDKIHEAVHTLLAVRGSGKVPRIGVSFLMQSDSEHEREAFVSHWLEHVDAVRIAERLDLNSTERGIELPERYPCGNLYDTLVVNHQGEATLCCLDAFSEVRLGNVLEQGCHAIWHCEKLNRFRKMHEIGRYASIPLCAGCESWAGYDVVERRDGSVIVRSSPLTTFYNRADRLDSWDREEFDKRYTG